MHEAADQLEASLKHSMRWRDPNQLICIPSDPDLKHIRMSDIGFAGQAVPKWAGLTPAGCEDVILAAVKTLLAIKWLLNPVQEKSRHQNTQSLQRYLELQQTLLLLMATHTGHVHNPDFQFQRIVGIHLLGVQKTWHELSEAAMTSPLVHHLMLVALQRMAVEGVRLSGRPDAKECLPFILKNLCKHLG